MQIMDSGAEAIIKVDNDSVIKERIKKDYRIDFIDKKLRKFRTRREAKILAKLNALGFPSPGLKTFSDVDMTIIMDRIAGDKLKDVLEENAESDGKEIGRKLAILHNNDIVHGDLTTSNMIKNEEIYFIDFGLSVFTNKIEDKAVDLHLLRQALESKHHKIWKICFDAVLEGYRDCNNFQEVLTRLHKVEGRGRNK